jgi:hypothetical protein
MFMRAFCLGGGLVGVALLARLVPGKLYWVVCNLSDRRPPIVPILAKALGNYESANYPKHQERDNE